MPTRSGDEVVLIAQVLELHFGKAFLQSDMRIQPRGAFPNVEIDDAVFLRRQVIDVDFGRDLDAPVRRAERRRVAMKQVEGERHVLAHEELPEASEKLRFAWTGRAYTAGNRQAAAVGERVAGGCDVEKRLVADDRIIALELVVIERIVPVALDVGHFEVGVAMVIGGKVVVPAIRNCFEHLIVGWNRRERLGFAGRGGCASAGKLRYVEEVAGCCGGAGGWGRDRAGGESRECHSGRTEPPPS